MIKKYYIYKNNKLGCYNEPFTTPYQINDQIEMIRRAIESNQIQNYEELSLYKLFELDDKTGEVKNGLEFIIDLSTLSKKND